MKKIIVILSISLLVLGGCTTKQVAEAPINTVEETTIKETTIRETIIETTMVEETTVAEESVSAIEEKYNGKTKDEILAINGWLDDNEKLYKNGKYIVFLHDTQKAKVMDENEAINYFEMIFNDGINYDIVGTSETNKLKEKVLSKIKNKQSEAKAEAFSSEVSSHIKTGSGVATVINDLNPYGYTTNNLGYVVPTEEAYKHMQTLKSGEFNLYRQTELEVFKKNNAGKVTVTNKQNEDYSGTQGTFNSWGHPSWVCREPNFQTTNALGGTVYAVCDNTLEEFRPYCDGTLIAFKGWHEKSYDPNSAMWYYNNGVLDSNLGAFVDWNWEWIGEAGERKFRKVN